MTSTHSDHKQTVRDLVTDVFNGGELDRIEEFYAEDSVLHNPAADEDIGRDEWRELMAGATTARGAVTLIVPVRLRRWLPRRGRRPHQPRGR